MHMVRVGTIAEVTKWQPDHIIAEYDDQIDDLAAVCQAILQKRKEDAAQP